MKRRCDDALKGIYKRTLKYQLTQILAQTYTQAKGAALAFPQDDTPQPSPPAYIFSSSTCNTQDTKTSLHRGLQAHWPIKTEDFQNMSTTTSRPSFLLPLPLLLFVLTSTSITTLDAFLLPPPPPLSRISSSSSSQRNPIVDQTRGGGISRSSTRRSRRITILTQQDQQQQQEQERQTPSPQQTIHAVGGIHVGLDNVTNTTTTAATSKPSSTISAKPLPEGV